MKQRVGKICSRGESEKKANINAQSKPKDSCQGSVIDTSDASQPSMNADRCIFGLFKVLCTQGRERAMYVEQRVTGIVLARMLF